MLIQEKASDDGSASLPWMEFYSCRRRRQPAMFARKLNIKDHIHCFVLRKSIGFEIKKNCIRKKFWIWYCSVFGYRHTLLWSTEGLHIRY